MIQPQLISVEEQLFNMTYDNSKTVIYPSGERFTIFAFGFASTMGDGPHKDLVLATSKRLMYGILEQLMVDRPNLAEFIRVSSEAIVEEFITQYDRILSGDPEHEGFIEDLRGKRPADISKTILLLARFEELNGVLAFSTHEEKHQKDSHGRWLVVGTRLNDRISMSV